jgi:beta-mannosidase
MRRRKGQAGGLCLWQFNEPWPAVSWAIVDYFGRPKLAWRQLRTWYAPVLVSLEFPVGRRWLPGDEFSARVWLINDTLHSYPDCTVHLDLISINHSQFTIHHSPLALLPPNQALKIDAFTHRLTAPPHTLTATLRHGDEVLSRNSYRLDWADTPLPPSALRLRRWLADWALK